MSLFTLLRNTSASRKMDFGGNHWEADAMAGNQSSTVCGLYSVFLLWKKMARQILLSNFSMSSVTFCQLTSLGTGQNAGPFVRRECSAYVSPDRYILYLHKKLYVCSNSVKYYDNILLINYKNLSLFTLNLLR